MKFSTLTPTLFIALFTFTLLLPNGFGGGNDVGNSNVNREPEWLADSLSPSLCHGDGISYKLEDWVTDEEGDELIFFGTFPNWITLGSDGTLKIAPVNSAGLKLHTYQLYVTDGNSIVPIQLVIEIKDCL